MKRLHALLWRPRWARPQYIAGEVLKNRVATCTCMYVAAMTVITPSLTKYAPTKKRCSYLTKTRASRDQAKRFVR